MGQNTKLSKSFKPQDIQPFEKMAKTYVGHHAELIFWPSERNPELFRGLGTNPVITFFKNSMKLKKI